MMFLQQHQYLEQQMQLTAHRQGTDWIAGE